MPGVECRSMRPSRARTGFGHGRARCPRPAGPGCRRGGTARRPGRGRPRRCPVRCRSPCRPPCRRRPGPRSGSGPGRARSRYLIALSRRLPKICSTARRSAGRLECVGRRPDLDHGTGALGLVALRVREAAQEAAHVEGLGPVLALALAREAQDRSDQPVHLAHRRLDEAERLGEIRVEGGRLRLSPRARAMPAQQVELAREAHDVDQRRPQVVADDVGVALHLLVRLGERQARASRSA